MAQVSNIQWFPGHMTKTKRQIEADLRPFPCSLGVLRLSEPPVLFPSLSFSVRLPRVRHIVFSDSLRGLLS